ncbi:MAG TPA: hydroxymethylbilane synthase [Rhodanobacteraceae bacterium]|nr:hydroxymethylbilane synthase [Rhodanobacteraceae bacterium]
MRSQPLRIATRKSPLALWQAEHVAARLRATHAGLEVQLVPLSTRGDEVLDRSLNEIGGKGLFLKELEIALADERADIAVHSLKDMPAHLEAGFAIGAVLARADPSDAFVSNAFASLDELPRSARVGTSSLRRAAQLRAQRADLAIVDLRGNVGTRLAKLDAGVYAAIVLATAGLQRLGLQQRIRARLVPPHWLPAPGQGAIAIETRAADPRIGELLAPLDDPDTRRTTAAERALNAALGGDCTLPLGAWCEIEDGTLHLCGMLGDADSGRVLRAEGRGDDPHALGEELARALRAQGGDALIAAL